MVSGWSNIGYTSLGEKGEMICGDVIGSINRQIVEVEVEVEVEALRRTPTHGAESQLRGGQGRRLSKSPG